MRVKLSSESAGYVALTPVVVREFSFLELLEHMLGATGPDARRVSELLRRGTLVAGASRYRWEAFELAPEEIEPLLRQLPGPEPNRPFHPGRCVRAVLCGPSSRLEVMREAASQRRLLKNASFWDALLAEAGDPAYGAYHYRERTDSYRALVDHAAAGRLREAAALLKFEAMRKQVRAAVVEAIEFHVSR